ncbi:phosphatase PAP2 family protein [Paenibacillus sp. WC2504]|uniref:phosphatase PAP2 family protein n=1 Tax=Paenibacillus sp. WC2504 TaxID=3461403 RepID=UPI004045C1F2
MPHLPFYCGDMSLKKRGRTTVILISILMILMIGISRIYLGVHYPSDVVGAYFASGFWFAFSVWIFQWYMENRAKRVRSIER